MWTVVYMAKGKKLAEKVSVIIKQEGVLVKIQPISKNVEEEEAYFEVLVPEAEVEEAHNIIYELGY
jgi:hypothetical protein